MEPVLRNKTFTATGFDQSTFNFVKSTLCSFEAKFSDRFTVKTTTVVSNKANTTTTLVIQ